MENPPTDGEARRVRDCAALPRYGSRGARGEGIGPPGILVRASFPTGKPETKQRQRALFFGRELSGGTFVLRDGAGRRSPTAWVFNPDLRLRAHLRSLRNGGTRLGK